MKPTTYLIYNESTGEWSAEPVTLAAARALPGVTLSTYLSTTDGARQLTVAQAISEEQAAAPAPTPAAHREPVYNAETNKWEYKEAAPSVFSKIKSVASGIITEINEACKEQAEAAREQHREPVYTLGGIPLETEPPKSAPVPSSPAPVPADTRSVPAEAAPVPPAGRSVPSAADMENERLNTFRLVRYTCRMIIFLIILGTFSGGIVSLLALTRGGAAAVILSAIMTGAFFGLLHFGLNRYDEYAREDKPEP